MNFNPDAARRRGASPSTPPRRASCPASRARRWNASHQSYDNGRNDGFVQASGPIAMRFWDKHDLPFTYSLVEHFPIGERYFCSTLGQTYPNRSLPVRRHRLRHDQRRHRAHDPAGERHDLRPARRAPHRLGDLLPAASSRASSSCPGSDTPARVHAVSRLRPVPIRRRRRQAAGSSPSSTRTTSTTSEENPQDIQVGEQFVAQVVHALMRAPHVEEHRPVHHLRRARRLLRPRARRRRRSRPTDRADR